MNDATTLPEVTKQELMVILSGLDELPGKYSRVLYDKIVGHVEAQKNVIDPPAAPPRRKRNERA